MKLFKSLLLPASFLIASSANAAIVTDTGVSVVNDNLDGTYTFIFDTGFTTDRLNTNGNGLTFSGFGLDLIVTGSGNVIQDWPSNGGLGVDGGAAGDNLGLNEWLSFSLSGGGTFDLKDISFNGSHVDAANGDLLLTTQNSSMAMSSPLNSVTDSLIYGINGQDMTNFGGFDDMEFLRVQSRDWNIPSWGNFPEFSGYIESITIGDVDVSTVPEPSILALFGAGILGLGFVRRRKIRIYQYSVNLK